MIVPAYYSVYTQDFTLKSNITIFRLLKKQGKPVISISISRNSLAFLFDFYVMPSIILIEKEPVILIELHNRADCNHCWWLLQLLYADIQRPKAK